MGKWIESLKPGTFKAKNGEEVTFTEADIEAIAAANPSTKRDAPLVFGHPEDNEPAFGWLEGAKTMNGILLTSFKDVPEPVKQVVKEKYYKKVSVALMPDKKTIRHVGLLGAVQPAVPGLADVKLSESKDELLIFEFSIGEPPDGSGDPNKPKPKEDDMPTVEELEAKLKIEKEAREAAEGKLTEAEGKLKTAETEAETAKTELSASKKAAEKATIESKVDALVGKKILAKEKPVVMQTALSLPGEDSIELSAGSGKKSTRDHYLDNFGDKPDLGLDMEFSDPGKDDGKALDTSGLTSCV